MTAYYRGYDMVKELETQNTQETFKQIKQEYENKRENERKALVNYFIGNEGFRTAGLEVVCGSRSGKGSATYTGGKTKPAYNLRNWKWVEVKKGNEFNCVISLNMPEVDPSSANTHAMYDRIGLFVTYHKGSHCYNTSIYSYIDLPLEDSDRETIAGIVLEQLDASGNKYNT